MNEFAIRAFKRVYSGTHEASTFGYTRLGDLQVQFAMQISEGHCVRLTPVLKPIR